MRSGYADGADSAQLMKSQACIGKRSHTIGHDAQIATDANTAIEPWPAPDPGHNARSQYQASAERPYISKQGRKHSKAQLKYIYYISEQGRKHSYPRAREPGAYPSWTRSLSRFILLQVLIE